MLTNTQLSVLWTIGMRLSRATQNELVESELVALGLVDRHGNLTNIGRDCLLAIAY